ncbi:MAG: CarD family transcriptional regulator [Clostridia bacterium]|nr:CarD family transcriptional regulator [Clostridia bacterium]
MRFKIGDKLAYPFYGAGIVEDIVRCEVLGETKEYYVMSFSGNRLKVNIPTDKAAETGLRRLISPDRLPEVYDHFKVEVDVKGETWSKRSKVSMDKLRGGDLLEAVEVYKYLRLRERQRTLSTGENKIYRGVYWALVSELSFVEDVSVEEIDAKLDAIFEKL